jgi:hypothetical protein
VNRTAALVVLLAVAACRAQPPRAKTEPTHAPVAAPVAGSAELAFWRWFREHDLRLFEFERDQESVFDDLAQALRRVHPDLTFEFGPKHGQKREFIVSAAGIRGAFPAVRSLVAAAPAMDHWTVRPFRPRRPTVNDIDLDGVHVRASDVAFVAEPDGRLIGITLLIPGCKATPHKTFEQIGYLLLDEALGELTVETQIGFVNIVAKTQPTRAKQQPLTELASTVDHWQASH